MEDTKELVTIQDNTPLADSRQIAEQLGIEHRSFFKMITDYQEEVEADFGLVRFQIAKPLPGSAGGRPSKYALLTEDQSYVFLAYSQNTKQARQCKRLLVKAFAEARQSLAQAALPMSTETAMKMLEQQYSTRYSGLNVYKGLSEPQKLAIIEDLKRQIHMMSEALEPHETTAHCRLYGLHLVGLTLDTIEASKWYTLENHELHLKIWSDFWFDLSKHFLKKHHQQLEEAAFQLQIEPAKEVITTQNNTE